MNQIKRKLLKKESHQSLAALYGIKSLLTGGLPISKFYFSNTSSSSLYTAARYAVSYMRSFCACISEISKSLEITTIKNRCDRRVGQKTVIADTLGEFCPLARKADKATDNIFIADNLMQRLPQGRQDSRHLGTGCP